MRQLGEKAHGLWEASLGRLGLQKRIFIFTATQVVMVAALFGFLGLRVVNEITATALGERLLLARSVASHLDYELAEVVSALEEAAQEEALPGRGGVEARLLREGRRPMGPLVHRVWLLDAEGRVVGAPPSEARALGAGEGESLIAQAVAREGRAFVSNLELSLVSQTPVVAIVAPVKREGRIVGLLRAEVDLTRAGIASFVETAALGRTGYLQVVDHHGRIIASGQGGQLFHKGDHSAEFAALIDAQRPVVRACHRCHESGNAKQKEVIAFAPLSVAPWGVAARQLEDEVLGPARGLEQGMLLVGAFVLAAGLYLAWLTTQQVLRPIQALQVAAGRVAAGDLDAPVPPARRDEVGRLAASFEDMRQKLKASLEAQRRWNERLEEQVKERTQQLTSLYEELRHKEGLRTQLLKKLISAQEEERKRVARELHDEAGQALTAIMMSAALAEQSLPEGEAKGKVGNIRSLAEQALANVRKVMFALRPEVLDDLGLIPALRWCVKNNLQNAGIQARLEVSGLEERLPPQVEVAVFRVIQEAITNIARHAQATRARVRLEAQNGLLYALVEDNGRGFEAQKILAQQEAAEGWGLRGMEERVRLLGGTLEISSRPGRGTRVSLRVPLAPAPEEVL